MRQLRRYLITFPAWLVFAAWAIQQSLFLFVGGVLVQFIR